MFGDVMNVLFDVMCMSDVSLFSRLVYGVRVYREVYLALCVIKICYLKLFPSLLVSCFIYIKKFK